jgi:hypothetical protein
MPITRELLDDGFAEIERAAVNDARCPTNRSQENPTGTLRIGVTTELVREGKIKIEVYAHNWRVVELLTGPNAGKRTQKPPYKYATKPYLVLPALAVSRPDRKDTL